MNTMDLLRKMEERFTISIVNQGGVREIRDVRFWENLEEPIEEDILYFGYPTQEVYPKDQSIQLVIGDSFPLNPDIKLSNSTVIILAQEHLLPAFNYAKDLLQEDLMLYQGFSEIIQKVIKGEKLDHVINAVASKLGNSVVVFDLSYNILAYSTIYPINNINWEEIVKQGHCSYEFIKAIKRLDEVKHSPLDSTAFKVECALDPMVKLCSKVLHKDTLIAYILMFENRTTISQKHHKLLPMVSLAVSQSLFQDPKFHSLKGSLYENILYDLLTEADPNFIQSRVDSLKLSFPSSMGVMAVSFSSEISNQYIKGFIRDELKGIFPLSHSLYYKEYIVVVTPMEENNGLTQEELKKLQALVQEENLHIGISYGFPSFMKLKNHFNQAHYALITGEQIHPQHALHFYETYWFYDLLSKSNLSPTTLTGYCHPALKKLKEYDNKNNTSFYETLEVYLEWECNIKKTSEILFIHRNSLSYRIKRIEEIGEIDLSNPKTKYALIGSCKILNFLDKVKGY